MRPVVSPIDGKDDSPVAVDPDKRSVREPYLAGDQSIQLGERVSRSGHVVCRALVKELLLASVVDIMRGHDHHLLRIEENVATRVRRWSDRACGFDRARVRDLGASTKRRRVLRD